MDVMFDESTLGFEFAKIDKIMNYDTKLFVKIEKFK